MLTLGRAWVRVMLRIRIKFGIRFRDTLGLA